MKLTNIKDINKFFEVIEICNGKVELVSKDCRINLKSNLAKYFSLATLFSAGSDEINEMEVIAYELDDVQKLIQFAMEQ